jgi:hypothetical protein
LRFIKVGFLVFIAMVIHCTAKMEKESQKNELVVAEAEFLGVIDFNVEELQGVLREGVPAYDLLGQL